MLNFYFLKEFIKSLLPSPFLSFYHYILAFLASFFYLWPSRKIKVIGVTGTNGKTTVTEMIAAILEKGGFKVALLNSIRFKIGHKEKKNDLRMTMPGRFILQKFLKEAVKEKCHYAVLEVTSEGIKQFRHKFIKFEIAVFTNLSPEHIESHGSFEKYREAKLKLFEATKKVHIINLEDKNSDYFLKIPAERKITFGLEKGDFNLENTKIELQIPGEFNLSNALSAFSVGKVLGVNEEIIREALKEFKGVPGRMEEIVSQPFKVIVDYAFTPNALEKVYQTLKENNNKLICVLGAAGGGRDKWKRPVLGEIASRYCEEIIVTNEDPYDEDPWQIIEQVAAGSKGKARKILDRREGIKEALKLAKEGDTVVITGKGCEPSIVIKGIKIPWDDREVVKEEFQKIYEKI
jgi:UDP-N-acetylmuramoyl-L-alanyl-D-glutamate--2,6-diaminopimelate ligase